MGVGGKDEYRAVLVDHDPKAAGNEKMQHVFDVMGQVRQFVDAGSPNRKWNDSLALVETDKAALMMLGDWAKGDFAAANKVIGKDFGCQMGPGNQDAYVMTVDVFVFPVNDKPDQKAAQDKLATLMMDPVVQTEFNAFKGSLPSRLDANVAELDACAQLGQKVMAGGAANQLPNFALAFGPDTQGQIEDLLGNYWSKPTIDAGGCRSATVHHHRQRRSLKRSPMSIEATAPRLATAERVTVVTTRGPWLPRPQPGRKTGVGAGDRGDAVLLLWQRHLDRLHFDDAIVSVAGLSFRGRCSV